jgi:hypothetical protein
VSFLVFSASSLVRQNKPGARRSTLSPAQTSPSPPPSTTVLTDQAETCLATRHPRAPSLDQVKVQPNSVRRLHPLPKSPSHPRPDHLTARCPTYNDPPQGCQSGLVGRRCQCSSLLGRHYFVSLHPHVLQRVENVPRAVQDTRPTLQRWFEAGSDWEVDNRDG